MAIQLLFLFDTTGSMRPASVELERRLKEGFGDAYNSIPDLQIAVAAHGDFCDWKSPYVYTETRFYGKDGLDQLRQEVSRIGKTYGGDGDECYAYALKMAVEHYGWELDTEKHIVMIGDARPHRAGYTYRGVPLVDTDWRSEVDVASATGIRVHAVQCLTDPRYNKFWQELAERGEGIYAQLGQFTDIVIGLQALTLRYGNMDEMVRFAEKLDFDGHLKNHAKARFLSTIFAGTPAESLTSGHAARAAVSFSRFSVDRDLSDAEIEEGLKPIPADYFQVLPIIGTIGIKEFVQDIGIEFQTGRGYYKLVKTETIQQNKMVVLQDKETGEFFTGATAREMIGLPFGSRGRIGPRDLPFDVRSKYNVYVQSTSWNRNLSGGTELLYQPRRERL